MLGQIIIEAELAGDGDEKNPTDPDAVLSAALDDLKKRLTRPVGKRVATALARVEAHDPATDPTEEVVAAFAVLDGLRSPYAAALEAVRTRLEASGATVHRAELQHVETADPRYLPEDDAPYPGS